MGRAGRVAPRICSTLELRTHSLTVSLPSSVKPAVTPQPLDSPASPGTPGQVAPASVRPVLQAWPQDALQVVQRQMEALGEASTPTTTRKRELEVEENGQGLEVLLQTQPALPNDWEQFLDLKTGQFYYLHWSSCKRAKQDPREHFRRADQIVEAHLREAHTRGESHIELATTTSPYDDSDDDEESEAGDETEEGCSSAPDVCERTSGICSVAPERCADRELGNDVECGKLKEEQATNVVCDEGKSAVMVVSGCHSCSMFVMLCVSSPACPSCGAGAVR